jgi:hypothetical protein
MMTMKPKVGYTANSLSDIAEFLFGLVQDERERAANEPTKKKRKHAMRFAEGLNKAAIIVEHTVLVPEEPVFPTTPVLASTPIKRRRRGKLHE